MDVTQLITTLELVAPIVSALKPSRDFLSLSLDTRVHQFKAVTSNSIHSIPRGCPLFRLGTNTRTASRCPLLLSHEKCALSKGQSEQASTTTVTNAVSFGLWPNGLPPGTKAHECRRPDSQLSNLTCLQRRSGPAGQPQV